METFKVTLTYTFIGSYYEARRDYEKSDYKNRGLSFLDWCEVNRDQTTNVPYQSPPDNVEEILTEEYLTSLGWRMVEQCNDNYFYSRDVNDRQEELRYSVYDECVLATITHVSGYYSAGVFSGKIDSRQTFEIILNAVS